MHAGNTTLRAHKEVPLMVGVMAIEACLSAYCILLRSSVAYAPAQSTLWKWRISMPGFLWTVWLDDWMAINGQHGRGKHTSKRKMQRWSIHETHFHNLCAVILGSRIQMLDLLTNNTHYFLFFLSVLYNLVFVNNTYGSIHISPSVASFITLLQQWLGITMLWW